MKKTLLAITCLLIILSALNAQTKQQVIDKAKKEGINTESEIDSALAEQNMTETQARKLAKQYGMDYDQFLSEYILTGKSSGKPQQTPSKKLKKTGETTKVVRPDTSQLQKQAKKESKNIEDKSDKDKLTYYGYNLFDNIPNAFQPEAVGPIDPGYLIGPGDVLRLYMWGEVEFQYELTVTTDGNIFIPTVGQVFVLGVPYEDLKDKLKNYLSKFYEGLTKDSPTVFLDVSIAKLKPLKIFVLGEVNNPGGYNIGGYSTVFNALYSIGGPLKSGSLRDIKVIRNNKLLTEIDLYDYLLTGKVKNDERLQSNDLIFIPPRGKTVAIKGEVKRPAIYEMKEGESLKTLIEYAGGLKNTAFMERAQVNRIIPFDERDKDLKLQRKLIDVNLSQIQNGNKKFNLVDGDTVTIFPIIDKMENFVEIEGAVYRPGTYELSTVPTLKKLVEEANGPLPEAYYKKVDIMRTKPNENYEFFTVNLRKALNNNLEHNITLQERDQVKIYSIHEIEKRRFVSIGGFVKEPISVPYADSLTLYDMIFKAGGLQDPFFRGKAYTTRGDLIRYNEDKQTKNVKSFDLLKVIDKEINIDMEPGDSVIVYKENVTKELDKTIRITGEVRQPGIYPLQSNMTVKDLILQAGGFNKKSLRTEIYVNRNKTDINNNIISKTIPLEIDSNLALRNDTNFKLRNDDIVVVRKNPNYVPKRLVSITGEIKYPGTYALEKFNSDLLTLINEAGGPKLEAYLFGTRFVRGGKRLIADVEELYYNKDQEENITLKDGDSIYIPSKPNTVLLTGEVNNPGLYKFIQGRDVGDYIKEAGGLTDSSNYAIYNKSNGESRRVNFGWFSSDPEVFDGSMIFVKKLPPPEPKGEGFDLSGTIKDIFALASSAATIIYILSRTN